MTRNERALKMIKGSITGRQNLAIKIAQFVGWKFYDEAFLFYKDGSNAGKPYFMLADEFSSFDGLMPIVCEINKDDKDDNDCYWISINACVNVNLYEANGVFSERFTDAETLIDALQEAIIFYYENR